MRNSYSSLSVWSAGYGQQEFISYVAFLHSGNLYDCNVTNSHGGRK